MTEPLSPEQHQRYCRLLSEVGACFGDGSVDQPDVEKLQQFVTDEIEAALRVQPPQDGEHQASLETCEEALIFCTYCGLKTTAWPPMRAHVLVCEKNPLVIELAALRAGAPTDRNAPSEPNLLHLADLAQANAIEQCAVEAGERSPEGVSSDTMLGDMWDRRIRNLRAAKPGNVAPGEQPFVEHHKFILETGDCQCSWKCVHEVPLAPYFQWIRHLITSLAKTHSISLGSEQGNVAPTATPAQPIFEEIAQERKRQDQKWGGPSHDDIHGNWDWRYFIYSQASAIKKPFRDQMIRVAALAVAAIESFDRKRAAAGTSGPKGEA